MLRRFVHDELQRGGLAADIPGQTAAVDASWRTAPPLPDAPKSSTATPVIPTDAKALLRSCAIVAGRSGRRHIGSGVRDQAGYELCRATGPRPVPTGIGDFRSHRAGLSDSLWRTTNLLTLPSASVWERTAWRGRFLSARMEQEGGPFWGHAQGHCRAIAAGAEVGIMAKAQPSRGRVFGIEVLGNGLGGVVTAILLGIGGAIWQFAHHGPFSWHDLPDFGLSFGNAWWLVWPLVAVSLCFESLKFKHSLMGTKVLVEDLVSGALMWPAGFAAFASVFVQKHPIVHWWDWPYKFTNWVSNHLINSALGDVVRDPHRFASIYLLLIPFGLLASLINQSGLFPKVERMESRNAPEHDGGEEGSHQ